MSFYENYHRYLKRIVVQEGSGGDDAPPIPDQTEQEKNPKSGDQQKPQPTPEQEQAMPDSFKMSLANLVLLVSTLNGEDEKIKNLSVENWKKAINKHGSSPNQISRLLLDMFRRFESILEIDGKQLSYNSSNEVTKKLRENNNGVVWLNRLLSVVEYIKNNSAPEQNFLKAFRGGIKTTEDLTQFESALDSLKTIA